MSEEAKSFTCHTFAGLALDPIHVGTGGSRLGRVDNTIVRDPATQIPKIPGSSLAGVMRAYVAMAKDKYPQCAGQGLGDKGHCRQTSCAVCAVFGFAKGQGDQGGFAGLAGFSDMQVLLFPVPTRRGPLWLSSPQALEQAMPHHPTPKLSLPDDPLLYYNRYDRAEGSLNLGWLELPIASDQGSLEEVRQALNGLKLPSSISGYLALVPDRLFAQVVNSNLEVRTSVAIDPSRGAAEEGALFTYEALPRHTVLTWDITCRNPKHFGRTDDEKAAVKSYTEIKDVVTSAHPYLEHLGIGGMGTRGMGRLRVLGEVQA